MSDPTDPTGPSGGADEQPDDVGSLGEEAVRLLGALGDWASVQGTDLGGAASAAAEQAAQAAREVDEHLATGSAECSWCPVCRTVHVLRQTSPEVREQLVVAAGALLQAGSGLLASLQASQAQRARDNAGGGRARADQGPDPTSVERIDLDDQPVDDDEWES